MSEFVIVTDSSADLPAALVKELGVEVLPLSFTLQGITRHNYPDDREMDPKEFYRVLRAGEMATTAAVNVADYTDLIDPILAAGKDVLVLAFSSGLSATYQSSTMAVAELREKYPERKIFTVDDLHFLKRGGRVSAATAVLGSMLHIKPVLHVDDEGHLINVGKARGRAASLTALVDHMEETAIDPGSQIVFISHGDCLAEAEQVAADVKKRFGVKKVVINNVGPVIGAHSGPGTMALFFLGTKR